jgi:hypothetical protein
MTQMANFLNSRKQVRWRLTERDGLASLEAADPKTLAHQAWRFPTSKYSEPGIVRGTATVQHLGDGWIVVAGEGTQLEVQARAANQ